MHEPTDKKFYREDKLGRRPNTLHQNNAVQQVIKRMIPAKFQIFTIKRSRIIQYRAECICPQKRRLSRLELGTRLRSKPELINELMLKT